MSHFARYAAASILVASSYSAVAQNDVMTSFYGNTLVCRSDHMQCHIWLDSNGTYRRFDAVVATNGVVSLSGTEGLFKVTPKGGDYEFCMQPRTHGGPGGRRAAECYGLGRHKVGDTWDAPAGGDGPLHFSLKAGRHVNAGSGFL